MSITLITAYQTMSTVTRLRIPVRRPCIYELTA